MVSVRGGISCLKSIIYLMVRNSDYANSSVPRDEEGGGVEQVEEDLVPVRQRGPEVLVPGGAARAQLLRAKHPLHQQNMVVCIMLKNIYQEMCAYLTYSMWMIFCRTHSATW